jgi:integrase
MTGSPCATSSGPAKWVKTKHRGVSMRHANACPANAGRRCNCQPSYRAQVWDSARQRPVKSPTFRNIDEARGWAVDHKRGLVTNQQVGPQSPTFRDLSEQILGDMATGVIGTRRHRTGFSERTLASYRSTLDTHVLPDYGAAPAAALTIEDWQRLVDKLARQGLATSTINNVLNPVRSIYRWACSPARGSARLSANPTVGLELPARDEKKRDRIASAAEAEQLLAALPLEDRVPYALALYEGLRRKEIAHSEWDWIEWDAGVILVGKTKQNTAGLRRIPLLESARIVLREWHLACGRPAAGLVCPPRKRSDSGLMSFDMLLKRTRHAWLAASLDPIGLHEARHTFASYLIAAGVNAKAVTEYMGHSSVDITFDRYGHLFPGNEDEAADLVNDYLKRAAR